MTEDELTTRLLALAAGGEPAVHRFDSVIAADRFRRVLRAKARAKQIEIRTALFDDSLLAVALHDAEFWHEPVRTIRSGLQ